MLLSPPIPIRSYGEVPEGLRQLVEAMSYLLIGACTPLVQATGAYAADIPPSSAFARAQCGPWAVRCTSPRCPHCSPGAPWRGEPAGGGGSSRAAGGADRDSGGSGGGGAAADPCPGRRLATNVSSALLHLLPALTHAVYRAAERGRTQWAAEATSDFISGLVPMCVRALADADRSNADPTSGGTKQQQQQQQPQTASKRQAQGPAPGRSKTGAGTEAGPEAGATCSPGAAPGHSVASGPWSWRDALLALDPIRLYKLQLRSGREPRCADCVYVARMLALAVGPELGAAVGRDGELCELLAARAAGAGAEDRKE